MNYTLQSFNNKDNEDVIIQHLNSLYAVCCLFYNNPNNLDGEKESLKIAEYFLKLIYLLICHIDVIIFYL